MSKQRKYLVWLKERDDFGASRWVEQGDGPMTLKTAERVAREITHDFGTPTVVKPAELTWIEGKIWA